MTTLHEATIKFPAKQYESKYQEDSYYLQLKATLSSGEDVAIFENNINNQAFLALRKGEPVQVIEEINRNGKAKFKLILPEAKPDQPTTRSSPAPSCQSPSSQSPILSQSERLDQLLDCFSEVLVRVEKRFPDREPDWQRAAATTLLIQLQKEYGQALQIAAAAIPLESFANNKNLTPITYDDPQPPSPVVREDLNKPWTNWRTPDDAVTWAQGELPDWDIDAIQEAFQELPGENGKKAKAWCEWVRKRKEMFGSAGKDTWF